MLENLKKNKITMGLAAAVLAVSATTGMVAAAHADTTTTSTVAAQSQENQSAHGGRGMGGRGMHQGVRGTVSAISGSTITVTGKDGKAYTVSTTGADISKVETVSVSDISVGDSVGVEGTVSGTNVAATHIREGMPKDAQQ